MTIFALDTSSKAASCALWRDDTLLGEFFLNIGLTHSQTVLPLADSLLRHTGLTMAQVDVFAVTTGPGSFTGLRIGIAAVKGMAMATDKPCAGVSTLESLAMNVSAFRGAILPVMDARRNQFYSGLFRCKGETLTRLEPDAPRPY